MAVTTAPVQIPGYVAGTWNVDPVHSDVSFSVRHMMVSKVRGRFTKFEGTIRTGGDFLASSVEASIDLNSIDTNNEQRDAHIRSADFFEVEKFPTMSFQSRSIREHGDGYVMDGELTLHGVTRPVELNLEVNGFSKDPYGGMRAGFSASTEINRKDFGIEFNMPMDGGGVVVGDKIQIALEIEAVLQAS
ncbi:MAG TPA: YceI family protein [Chloroflexota bacterium]|nr:YceI family protein [Chloroflexota bacterium]